MPPSVQARPFTGIALKVVSTLVFTAMATLIKLVSARYPVGELTFFRSFFALIPVCAWVGWRQFPGIFRTSRFGGHFVRSIAGATAMFCGFTALALLPIAAAIVVVAAACGKDSPSQPPVASKIVTFKADLKGSNEVPANTSTGTGTFTATLDTSTNVFTYDVTFTGLSSTVTLGHIHAPALTGANANPALNFDSNVPGNTFTKGATSGTAHGVVTLNAATTITATINGDSLKKLLFAGQTYANIHTATAGTAGFPAGEIRGQITKQ